MDPLRLGICCSLRNSAFASDLNARLTRNLGLAETLIIADDEALAGETWEQASACTAVLILLDSNTARGPVRREAWQSLLKHNGEPPVAVVRLEDCQYPKLLERGGGRFHAMTDPLKMARWVERWVVSNVLPVADAAAGFAIAELPVTYPSEWWTQVVDQPGAIEVPDLDSAQAFAHEAAAHFDGVCWMGCEDAPPDALTAEIEHRSEGGRRLLFVLAGAEWEIAGALKQSRHSFLIVRPCEIEPVFAGDDPAAAWVGACPHAGFPKLLLERMAGADAVDWGALLVVPLSNDGSWIRPVERYQSTEESRALCVKVLEEIFGYRRRWIGLCRQLTGTCATALRAAFSDELCLDLALFLLDEGRRAEAVGWLRILIGHASNEELRERAATELSWLVDDLGFLLPRHALPGNQLDFGFTGFDGPPAATAQELAEQALLAELLAAETSSMRPPDQERVRQLRLPLELMSGA